MTFVILINTRINEQASLDPELNWMDKKVKKFNGNLKCPKTLAQTNIKADYLLGQDFFINDLKIFLINQTRILTYKFSAQHKIEMIQQLNRD